MRAASLSSVLFTLVACSGEAPTLAPIAPQSAHVRETLRIALTVENADAVHSFAYEAPETLVGVDRSATISGSGASGEFRWEPQTSHVGTHEFTFILFDATGDELDREPALITVEPAADAAPIFLRPGAGGTYDLERDPCVRFPIEVRDDDSSDVEIGATGELPEGASVSATGPKSGEFEWCPSQSDIAVSERWTIHLTADDASHEATEHDYVVVLRTGPKEGGCEGEPPVVTFAEPGEGARVSGDPGFVVRIAATDDRGLRDAPVLYYTTTMPDDPEKPDVTAFEQVLFEGGEGSEWIGRVPSLGLADGAEATVFLVVSATDNDDATGTTCDHRIDTALRSFVAVGGGEGRLARCASCFANSDCASGICALASAGARCLDACESGCASGTCASQTTRGGTSVMACGPVSAVCGGAATDCTDDSFEENDDIDGATMATDSLSAHVCSDDLDYFRITSAPLTQISVTIDGFSSDEGDLDLALLDSRRMVRAVSADITDSETVTWCNSEGGAVFARVEGYDGDENGYDLTITRTTGACCVADEFEEDDSESAARAIVGTDFEGTICPGDPDFIRFVVSSPGTVEIVLVLDDAIGDLDLKLFGPRGALVGRSTTTTSMEEIRATVTETGTYTIQVYGYLDGSGPYLGMVTQTSGGGMCTSTTEDCPAGQVCNASMCRDATCTSDAMCPAGHGCPTPGPSAGARLCSVACTVNSDCRSTEACKRLAEGRFCTLRGAGQNGDACTRHADCGGQRACASLPGGYCARLGCATNADCETDTYCVAISGQNVCAKSCWDTDAVCRTGYSCRVLTDLESDAQFVCAPSGS
jgi:hypothetical protein